MSNRYFKEGSLSFTAKERREIDQIEGLLDPDVST